MNQRKSNIVYNFSVEGETERWYLKWLEGIINQNKAAKYRVSIKCDVQKDPMKYAKKHTLMGQTVVYHFSDYESDEEVHRQQFCKTIDRMTEASKYKQITYKFGYSNLTFDLWIILHKIDCNGHICNRKQYIMHINTAYGERFKSMTEYKQENDFKRCLSRLNLDDVVRATNRARTIMDSNTKNGYHLHRYKGYEYYEENPSLAIGDIIGAILKKCGLMDPQVI